MLDEVGPAGPGTATARQLLRCAHCEGDLGELALHRPLLVPAPGSVGRYPLLVEVVYCGGCGTVIGTAPPTAGEAPAPPARAALRSHRTVTGAPAVAVPVEVPGTTAPEAPTEENAVELVMEPDGRLHGRAGALSWDTSAELKGPSSWLRGRAGDEEVSLSCQFGPTEDEQRWVRVAGRWGEHAVRLEAALRLGPDGAFDNAPVEGQLRGVALRAGVSAAPGRPDGEPRTVVARGSLGDVRFELFATAAPASVVLRGSLGRHPVSLEICRRAGAVRVEGSFRGEPALLALLIGSAARHL